jgi:diaminopimelate decarboxylase
LPVNYNILPSPCYVIDEKRFRDNLSLIRHVSDESGAEIILAFKGFAMWGVFDILKEYVSGFALMRLAPGPILTARLIVRKILKKY